MIGNLYTPLRLDLDDHALASVAPCASSESSNPLLSVTSGFCVSCATCGTRRCTACGTFSTTRSLTRSMEIMSPSPLTRSMEIMSPSHQCSHLSTRSTREELTFPGSEGRYLVSVPEAGLGDGSLWFSSAISPNPSVFDGRRHHMEYPVDFTRQIEDAPRQIQDQYATYSGLSSTAPPPCAEADDSLRPGKIEAEERRSSWQSIDFDDQVPDGVAPQEGEVEEEEEVVDDETNLMYDDLLTHFLDEIGCATKEILTSYYANLGLSSVTTGMTIVLNALIMVARHLSIPAAVITIFAAMNMIAKGLEMKFKFGHEAQNLQGCLEDAKMLSAEAEDLLLKCKHANLEASEIMEFQVYYSKAFREFAYYVPARELDDKQANYGKASTGGKVKTVAGEDDCEQLDDAAQALFIEQLGHYQRQINSATKSLKKAYFLANSCCTVLTMMTLCINPMIISAGEMHLDHTLVAYLAGVNTIVKGFELRFKFEHQRSHLERQLEKAHVLKTEVEQLMILGEAAFVSEIEVSSFKRALDDAMEGFAMYMLDGDDRIQNIRRRGSHSAVDEGKGKEGDKLSYQSIPASA